MIRARKGHDVRLGVGAGATDGAPNVLAVAHDLAERNVLRTRRRSGIGHGLGKPGEHVGVGTLIELDQVLGHELVEAEPTADQPLEEVWRRLVAQRSHVGDQMANRPRIAHCHGGPLVVAQPLEIGQQSRPLDIGHCCKVAH